MGAGGGGGGHSRSCGRTRPATRTQPRRHPLRPGIGGWEGRVRYGRGPVVGCPRPCPPRLPAHPPRLPAHPPLPSFHLDPLPSHPPTRTPSPHPIVQREPTWTRSTTYGGEMTILSVTTMRSPDQRQVRLRGRGGGESGERGEGAGSCRRRRAASSSSRLVHRVKHELCERRYAERCGRGERVPQREFRQDASKNTPPIVACRPSSARSASAIFASIAALGSTAGADVNGSPAPTNTAEAMAATSSGCQRFRGDPHKSDAGHPKTHRHEGRCGSRPSGMCGAATGERRPHSPGGQMQRRRT